MISKMMSKMISTAILFQGWRQLYLPYQEFLHTTKTRMS
jgi:hypothetical protein